MSLLLISEADVHCWRNDSNFRFPWKVTFYCTRGYKKGNLKWKKLWEKFWESFAYHRPGNVT